MFAFNGEGICGSQNSLHVLENNVGNLDPACVASPGSVHISFNVLTALCSSYMGLSAFPQDQVCS